MQITDWATLGLCLLAALIESRRGSLTAWTDAIGLLIGLRVADLAYPLIASEAMAPSTAYLLVVCSSIVLIGLLSWQVQTSAAKFTGPVDKIAGAFAGLAVGLGLSYGMFHYIMLSSGRGVPVFNDSFFRPYLHDMVWLKALVELLRHQGVNVRP
jgi:hypothetical protein